MDVTVHETSIFGDHIYRVFVDGALYEFFISKKPLTASEQYDVAQGYKEGLEK